jgi:hypothetical protein
MRQLCMTVSAATLTPSNLHAGDGMDASHPLTAALVDREGREYGF